MTELPDQACNSREKLSDVDPQGTEAYKKVNKHPATGFVKHLQMAASSSYLLF